MMIPNNPILVEALIQWLVHKVFAKRFLQHSKQADRIKSMDAKAEALTGFREAYGAMRVEPYHKMSKFLEENWFQRLKRTKLRVGERNLGSNPYELYGIYLNQSYGNPPRNFTDNQRYYGW